MLIFNTTAIVCVIVGLLGGFASYQVTGSHGSVVYGGLITAIAVDAWCRFRDEETDSPLIHPDAGGHLWFVPVWGVGIVLIVLFALSHFRVI